MILPQSKILTLFAAVAMIPVLALPVVPDYSSISDSLPLSLATDGHSPGSPQVTVGKEISMSKRMDPGYLSPEPKGPGKPALLYPPYSGWTSSTAPKVIQFPDFERLTPLAFTVIYDGPDSFQIFNEKVAMLLVDTSSNVVYRLKKNHPKKEPSLRVKMAIIENSESYRTRTGERRVQMDKLFEDIKANTVSGSHIVNGVDSRIAVDLNPYYILAKVPKEQIKDRIEQFKKSIGPNSQGHFQDYSEAANRVLTSEMPVSTTDMVALYLADPTDGSFLFSEVYEAERITTQSKEWQDLTAYFGSNQLLPPGRL
ncbi:hypothetical protein C8R42DRAFT_692162 [Lentinula raphanica]|nr:hypothetical protein C8R42DRAFT_692162 [Lentinula raphanica]